MDRQRMTHWTFAQKVAPKLLTQPPAGMDPRLAETREEADAVLARMWRATHTMLQEPASPPPQAARIRVGGQDGLVVVMPPPERSPEAFFVASVPVGGQWRCYAWERSSISPGAHPFAALRVDGRDNLGARLGEPKLDTFCAHLSEIIGQDVEIVDRPFAPGGRHAALVWAALLLFILGGAALGVWAGLQ